MIVYTYGFKPQFSDRQAIGDELYKANKYRNKLTELYLAKIERYRALRLKVSPEWAATQGKADELEKRLDELRDAHKSVPKKERAKHPLSIETRQVRDELKTLRAQLKANRDGIDAQIQGEARVEFLRRKNALIEQGNGSPHEKGAAHRAVLAEMLDEPQWSPHWKESMRSDADYADACKLARAECGLSVGTYLAIEDADKRSQKTSEGDPGFKRFEGGGKLGHQCTKGVNEKMLQLEPITSERYPNKTPEELERAVARGWVWCRFNIGKMSAPQWIEGRLSMDRPLPAGVRVRWVYLVAKRVGLRTKYEIQFTLDYTPEKERGIGVCAVNVGWRKVEQGDVRIAYYVDDQGKEQELKLPAKIRDREKYADTLIAAADAVFNEAKAFFGPKLKAYKKKPDWMVEEEIKFIHAWRSHRKLARISLRWKAEHEEEIERLWREWKKERGVKPVRSRKKKLDLLDDYKTMVAWAKEKKATHPLLVALEWWRRKDAHLVQGAMSIRNHMALFRREYYRVTARSLASRYDTVVVAPKAQKQLTKNPEVEDDTRTPQEKNSGRARQRYSPGAMAEELRKIDGKTAEVDTKGITFIHFDCGGKATGSSVEGVALTCGKCGELYDQDRNAALHLLQRFKDGERSGSGKKPGTARKGKTPISEGYAAALAAE